MTGNRLSVLEDCIKVLTLIGRRGGDPMSCPPGAGRVTAAYNPSWGETPEATAIAIDSGTATIATVSAAIMSRGAKIVSLRQYRGEFRTIEMGRSRAITHRGETDLD